MNELQLFSNSQFGTIRATVKDGEPMFIAADVCRALEHSNATMALDRLDEDEKAKLNLGLSGGPTNCVTESGLYALVLGSRKPEARQFKRWITHEVIPTIRKTGGYVGDDGAFLSTYLPYADEQTRDMFRATLQTIRSLNTRIEQDKPKVLFADAVAASHTSILVGELAKLLKQNGVEIGQNRMFDWLRSNGYLIRRQGNDYNMPTQRSMDLGLFEIKETVIAHADGHTSVNKTPKVTGKGQQYFVRCFLGNFITAESQSV